MWISYILNIIIKNIKRWNSEKSNINCQIALKKTCTVSKAWHLVFPLYTLILYWILFMESSLYSRVLKCSFSSFIFISVHSQSINLQRSAHRMYLRGRAQFCSFTEVVINTACKTAFIVNFPLGLRQLYQVVVTEMRHNLSS